MSIKNISPVYNNKYEFVEQTIGTGKQALDIGSGNGEYLELLKTSFKNVYGIDCDINCFYQNGIELADAE